MSDDGSVGPRVAPSCIVDCTAAMPEHVPHRAELRVKRHELAREATGDLLHGLQGPHNVDLPCSIAPHVQGPLPNLKKHSQEQSRIANREHDGDATAREGKLAARCPETSPNLVLERLQGANPVLGLIRAQIIPGPRSRPNA